MSSHLTTTTPKKCHQGRCFKFDRDRKPIKSQGLSNGESAVVYKHPEDPRVFGQYTFKDERCLYETVYYYVSNGRFEFTNPYIADESNFNLTNKITFVKNHNGYEIEYNISPHGVGIFQNLGHEAEIKILPAPIIKKTPAPPAREIVTRFSNLGKQNLKVSYLRNGENYIQFISSRNVFKSIEGQYTFRTSDRKYHSITYEIPIDDLDYNGMVIREYEMSTEENFFKTGILRIGLNNTSMDVKYFVDRNGFHVIDLQKPIPVPVLPVSLPVLVPIAPPATGPVPPPVPSSVPTTPVSRPTQPAVRPVPNVSRQVVNQQARPVPRLLTGERVVRI